MSESTPRDSGCVLIYDGQCRLCTTTKAALEHWPGSVEANVRYLPYTSPEAVAMLGAQHRPGRPEVAYLVEPGGHVAEGAESFLRLFPRFPGGKLLSGFLRLPPMYGLVRRAYALVARHRYRWFGAVR